MGYTCKACINIPAVHLCADRVKCQPVVSMVTEWDVSAQCKLQSKYYQINLATVVLRAALWLYSNLVFLQWPDFDPTLQNPGPIHH